MRLQGVICPPAFTVIYLLWQGTYIAADVVPLWNSCSEWNELWVLWPWKMALIWMSSWSQVLVLYPKLLSTYPYRRKAALLTQTNVLTLTNCITMLYTCIALCHHPGTTVFLLRLPAQLFFSLVSKLTRYILPDMHGEWIKGKCIFWRHIIPLFLGGEGGGN